MKSIRKIKRIIERPLNMSKYSLQNQKNYQMSKYHISINSEELKQQLQEIQVNNLEEFTDKVMAKNLQSPFEFQNEFKPLGQDEALEEFYQIIQKNKIFDTYIGQGFYGTKVPPIVKRMVLENPQWYTAYTPYQAEISQGRLEAIFNYQVMVKRITKMDFANASLLDEASAAGEGVLMAWRILKKAKNTVLVSDNVFMASQEIIKSYSNNLGINVVVAKVTDTLIEQHKNDLIGVVLQTPDTHGLLHDHSHTIRKVKALGGLTIVGTDLLSQLITTPVGDMGADIVYGNGQRFGVPMWYGGPHAAFFASRNEHLRQVPGRIIGISKDRREKPAFRISLATREQHIKRERATSNICTAQVLLANTNFFYALWHGEEGLISIAQRIHFLAQLFASELKAHGFQVTAGNFFDTVQIISKEASTIHQRLLNNQINCFRSGDLLQFSFDETSSLQKTQKLLKVLTLKEKEFGNNFVAQDLPKELFRIEPIFRSSDIFSQISSEHEVVRYINNLSKKDITLCDSMIPLGSCTMKLNSAYQLDPLTHEKMNIHPMVPVDQALGYQHFIKELSKYLLEIIQMDGVSYMSNSGATGEYSGLLSIKQYHEARGESHRNVVIIPDSAHGTNPASAAKLGLKQVVIKTFKNGYIDFEDLQRQIKANEGKIFGMMLTYPSTFGVFEEETDQVVDAVRKAGGLVYIDGANTNAHFLQTSPGKFADVCHLNLHKSFCIPHGGGGPGHGPILCKKHLIPFLPRNFVDNDLPTAFDMNGPIFTKGAPISNSIYSSASILSISYLYLKATGLKEIKSHAIQACLNANYLRVRLQKYYSVLFKNANGFQGHEIIVDIRDIKKQIGIDEQDVCKRLMDFGFHAPTQAFPLPGILMIEPTESEPFDELERFVEAMVHIRQEIDKVASGQFDALDNPLKNAPHTLEELMEENWSHKYTREEAAYPLAWVRSNGKVWPSVSRIDGAFGEKNLKFDFDQQIRIIYLSLLQQALVWIPKSTAKKSSKKYTNSCRSTTSSIQLTFLNKKPDCHPTHLQGTPLSRRSF